jgi:hypothetical protein
MVKVYEARIKALKKQVVDLGGKVGDMKTDVAQELKRGHDQVDTKESYLAPMLRPEKRVKSKDDRVEVSLEISTESSTSPSSTSSSTNILLAAKPVVAPSNPVRHAKPKRSDFTRSIPLGKEMKFASTRLSKPYKLHNPTKSSSHVTAVLQSLRHRQSTRSLDRPHRGRKASARFPHAKDQPDSYRTRR